MSVALLIFVLNEVDAVVRCLRSLHGAVDEIIVVDSSPSIEHDTLQRLTKEYAPKVYRAIPTGFPEPLRPFGLSKVESDYALILDADEEVAEPLKRDLRNLNECPGYVVPRFEEGLRSYTFHLRLVRPAAVRYCGRSFDFPEVLGRVGRLDKSHRIVHHADYANYLGEKSRAERYFTIENAERPFTRQYLKEALTLRFGERSVSLPLLRRLKEPADTPLSPRMTRAVIEIEFLRDLVLGKGLSAATFNRRYSLGKRRFLLGLPETERQFLNAVARDIRQIGGLFPYLGVDNPAYIERLTSSFKWNVRGIDVYRNLLRYRYEHGKQAESVPLGSDVAAEAK